MRYSILENGWAVDVHESLESMSTDDLKELVELVLTHKVVVLKGQHLSTSSQLEICNSIGKCSNMRKQREAGLLDGATLIDDQIIKISNVASYAHVLDWHADVPNSPGRRPLHWLSAVNDSHKSSTSWLNMAAVYSELPDDIKDWIHDKKIVFGNKIPEFSQQQKPYEFDVVYENELGVKNVYYPYLQDVSFINADDKEAEDIHSCLVNFMMQDKFMYHHKWTDGDVVLSDQWGTLHRRDIYDYDTDRLMYRIALDYSNVWR